MFRECESIHVHGDGQRIRSRERILNGQRVQGHLLYERRIVGPQPERVVLEAQRVVTELGRLVRRELHPLLKGVLDSLQALRLSGEFCGSGLEYLRVLVRLAEIVLH